MNKVRFILSVLVLLVLLVSCTSTKNTGMTRWYHSFNTRYNVYFNGKTAYDEAAKAQLEGHQDNFTETIVMFPVSALPKDKQDTGGPFDKAIEKSVKAIKQHSIQTKPEKKNGKRSDPKYQEFMSRTEYNPFLYNAWLLMAKSQFHNGDFLQAASSFSYISRLYSSQPKIASEAKIWHARAYAEMEWFYEAEDMLAKMDTALLNKDKDIRKLWTSAKADLLIKQKNYEDAIPFLQSAIKTEKNKFQREREKYLLGQLYTNLGENALAYQTFGKISSAHAPYVLEFSAKIRQTEVYPGGNVDKSIRDLNRMAKSSKNKEYLDQVFYAMGNVYMSVPDTLKALESYEKGVKESTRHGIDKALNQIQLGDIYFELKDYVKAQPNYSDALGQLKKGDTAYSRVSKRSEVLDELVIFHEAVVLQDSLLRLSEMTEEEQMKVVKKIIDDLIKAEEEEQRNADREEFLAQQEANRAQNRPPTGATGGVVMNPQDAGLFYFYNPQVVAKGKADFQQKWGRRKLEDNWRRKTKTAPVEDMLAQEEELPEDGLPEGEQPEGTGKDTAEKGEQPEASDLSSDPKDPEFYLQQIPKTEEDKAAAHLIIADGLFNMAVIYKDKLEDLDLSLETFDDLDIKYPENENKLEAYYHTYMIYFRKGDMANANLYKQKIKTEFPESEYALAMADPDYEYNLKMMHIIPDSLYQATYDAYLEGNIESVQDNYTLITEKYNQTKLMPKFIFLNALSYVQKGDAEKFKEGLKTLIDKYPSEDVSSLASEMMKGFQRGLVLSGDGMIARSGLFNLRFGGLDDIMEDPSEIAFSEELKTPYELLLIYPNGALDDNLLLYTVASYNFGHFQVNDFDLEPVKFDELSMLIIKPFDNLGQVLEYIDRINQPEGYGQSLGFNAVMMPISVENYEILMKGKSLEEYMTFFEEKFGKNNEKLIERWNLIREAVEEDVPEENVETEGQVVADDSTEPAETESPAETIVEEQQTIEEPEDKVSDEQDSPADPEVVDQTEEKEITETEREEVIEVTDPADPVESTQAAESHEKTESVDVIESAESTDEIVSSEPVEAEAKVEAQTVEEEVLTGEDKLDPEQEESPAEEEELTDDYLIPKKGSSVSIEEYVKRQEQAEKERLKQEKEEQKAKEKAEKEYKKQQEKEAKALKKEQEKERKEEAKAKAEEKKQKEKAKAELRKQKEQDRKEAKRIKEQERKERDKLREAERKQKEADRKEAQRLKEQERKEKAKAREAERKQKEKERRETKKQREAERKAK